ncbi:GDP-L-fucose synthase [Labrys sp. KNU-23]|uniref:GDP-L-fucose synthase family protein n=1 Tax=Labrys sp. KNU-23 TaxID=2789216 RepID=UPI0011EE9A59|nr:GDP-L-fucose synthase [Labrys sp. KNU-23]QEN88199.1 GDP-L-fucose synthase [Labrys sp. KNU-23]
MMSLQGKRVWVAGHRGMVGAALMRRLQSEDCALLTAGRAELDLRRQAETEAWIERMRPEVIFLAAAKVGGILANASLPADFLYDNLAIEANVVHAAARAGVGKLVLLGSSCIYPREAAQPIGENQLLSGPLEPTNEWYAIAKIAGLKLVQAYRRQHGCDFIAAMPCNLYGPHDNFDLASSHVLAAFIRRVHDAKLRGAPSIEIWGSGTPRREFLHVDDCADALVRLAKDYSDERPINIGAGRDITILELLEAVKRVIGYAGATTHDLGKPDGTPRKLMDSSRIAAFGWRPRIGLEEGLAETYAWYLAQEGRTKAAKP